MLRFYYKPEWFWMTWHRQVLRGYFMTCRWEWGRWANINTLISSFGRCSICSPPQSCSSTLSSSISSHTTALTAAKASVSRTSAPCLRNSEATTLLMEDRVWLTGWEIITVKRRASWSLYNQSYTFQEWLESFWAHI